MPFTTGLVSRRGVVATVDAPPVALLKRAGAIPLGVTNTSELCMWLESHNHIYGITNNPYDLERIPGGSSGQHLVSVPNGETAAEQSFHQLLLLMREALLVSRSCPGLNPITETG